ncbi:fumarylacetoacetate hydrolase family protein [Candidatus Halobonum tyrrellensis]|uniref:fumarylacetoacetate hydrolase family protein n=1 Tax=Candidatus Halobonum tyrrellensis TaxID=1431545 RepID=UPI000677D79F|nr:fumarylacetoacetate hydrolase family protein [Candidatus Halobonum tyrrellensis]
MRYYRIERDDDVSLVASDEETAYDLTATEPGPTSFHELASAAALTDDSVDEVAAAWTDDAPTVDRDVLEANLIRPLDPEEIWGAGVTYSISQEARQEDSSGGLAESYLNAYEGDRPEVYFKATPSRTVGPDEAVGIRGDSEWDVPEPELTMILYKGDIVGYTVGNDVCSRSIERENLLYLPQSKIYAKSCALGPCISTGDTIGDPHDVRMELTISRDGDTVFQESTSTSEMVRSVDELNEFFQRYNEVPELTALLTGTSIIPPDDVTLEDGDDVAIEIEGIGTLENPVELLDS